MKKVMFIFGTRPEAIKMAPVIKELRSDPISFDVKVCTTGQHKEMLRQVLDFFHITPDYDLDIMTPNQTLSDITSRIFAELSPVIDREGPDIVLVQGDTTTALVGGVVGFYHRALVGHIEAGLRSGDIYAPFPEEANRAMLSRVTTYHFAPTDRAVNNLVRENIDKDKIFKVGNTVIDALLDGIKIVRADEAMLKSPIWSSIDFSKRIVLITGHRRENFGEGFLRITEAIRELSDKFADIEFIYPVHLNPKVKDIVTSRLDGIDNVHLLPPLSYPELLWIMDKAVLVLTDSGGIQEEAPALGKPVLVMRETTERQEGVEAGTAELVGTDKDKIVSRVSDLLIDQQKYERMANAINPYGDGTASIQIKEVLQKIT